MIRVLIAKPGLDGHDQGAKVVVQALRDAGMEVIYMGLHQTITQIVNAAIQEDVDVIGLSVLTGGHIPIAEKLMKTLKAEKVKTILVLFGGNIPKKDHTHLKKLGVTEVFSTGARFDDIANYIKTHVKS